MNTENVDSGRLLFRRPSFARDASSSETRRQR